MQKCLHDGLLWFDVGIKRYTTAGSNWSSTLGLWFDVGIKRYTTMPMNASTSLQLWFDVGIKRYTTSLTNLRLLTRCGLM